MKNFIKTIIKPVIALAVVASATIGCSRDFLTTTPVGRDLEVNYYQTQEQAFAALVSVYDVLSVERPVRFYYVQILNECGI